MPAADKYIAVKSARSGDGREQATKTHNLHVKAF